MPSWGRLERYIESSREHAFRIERSSGETYSTTAHRIAIQKSEMPASGIIFSFMTLGAVRQNRFCGNYLNPEPRQSER